MVHVGWATMCSCARTLQATNSSSARGSGGSTAPNAGNERLSRSRESDAGIALEWNIQRKCGTGYSPFEVMYGTPSACTLCVHALWLSARSSTAETVTGIAARLANSGRRSGAIDRNKECVAVLPELFPGDKCILYQPASGGLATGKGRSRSFVPAFSGSATAMPRISNVGYCNTGFKATWTDATTVCGHEHCERPVVLEELMSQQRRLQHRRRENCQVEVSRHDVLDRPLPKCILLSPPSLQLALSDEVTAAASKPNAWTCRTVKGSSGDCR